MEQRNSEELLITTPLLSLASGLAVSLESPLLREGEGLIFNSLRALRLR
jgi:hypothetical protein